MSSFTPCELCELSVANPADHSHHIKSTLACSYQKLRDPQDSPACTLMFLPALASPVRSNDATRTHRAKSFGKKPAERAINDAGPGPAGYYLKSELTDPVRTQAAVDPGDGVGYYFVALA